MRHLYALGATAALVLAASEAGAQAREVVLFPNTAAPSASAASAPSALAPAGKVLSWAGKRESRYSPRTSAPGRAPQPVAAAAQPLPVYAQPAPVVIQPVVATAQPARVPYTQHRPIIGSAPTPDMDFPRPAARASLYVPAPVYAAPPATARSIYDTPPPAQPQAVAARPAPQPAPQPVAAAPQRSAPAITAVAPPPVPAAVQTASAPAPRPAVTEPWRARIGDNGPRVYSVHRQFGLTPDPTSVSAAPRTKAAEPLPSEFFLAGRSPAEPDADEAAAAEETPLPEEAPRRPRRRSNRR